MCFCKTTWGDLLSAVLSACWVPHCSRVKALKGVKGPSCCVTIMLCDQVCCNTSNNCFSSCHTRVVCLQVLEAGALKPLIEHMNGQQFSWLQGLVSGKAAEVRAAEAPAVACFLAGCSFQGFRYSPAYYGCLVPYMPVSVPPLGDFVCGSVIGTCLKSGTSL